MKYRYFVDLSYRGTQYHGWQSQKNAVTIQETLEQAFSTILGEPTAITGSGRTDAGVHARQQIAHFEARQKLAVDDLKRKLNGFLPFDIAINSIKAVTEQAHARYTAYSRGYKYFMHQHKNPFLQDTSLFYWEKLDLDLMNAGAKYLIGNHDFQCFSKSNTNVKHYLCNINQAEWRREQQQLVFYITANRFLRGMVRAIVGSLLMVGKQKWPVERIGEIIEAKDRRQAGKSAAAHGLFLTSVKYPLEIFK